MQNDCDVGLFGLRWTRDSALVSISCCMIGFGIRDTLGCCLYRTLDGQTNLRGNSITSSRLGELRKRQERHCPYVDGRGRSCHPRLETEEAADQGRPRARMAISFGVLTQSASTIAARVDLPPFGRSPHRGRLRSDLNEEHAVVPITGGVEGVSLSNRTTQRSRPPMRTYLTSRNSSMP